MFIVHNAIRNLWRNKGRSVLIIIVATIIAAASTIGFAIVQAAQRARASALENTTIGAQISTETRSCNPRTPPGRSLIWAVSARPRRRSNSRSATMNSTRNPSTA